jgi:hypothetical protein
MVEFAKGVKGLPNVKSLTAGEPGQAVEMRSVVLTEVTDGKVMSHRVPLPPRHRGPATAEGSHAMIVRVFAAALLALFTLTTVAGAESAWVLWEQTRKIIRADDRETFRSGWKIERTGTWNPAASYSRESDCRRHLEEVLVEADADPNAKVVPGRGILVNDDRLITHVCLPSTIDPRGPKGSGR